jgi:hypothetical protein
VLDLFGIDIAETVAPERRRRGRDYAHAGTPGLGPRGECCGGCAHFIRRGGNKVYFKCNLVQWTHGAATDIRKSAQACERWEAVKP